jgi:hypothetical protein
MENSAESIIWFSPKNCAGPSKRRAGSTLRRTRWPEMRAPIAKVVALKMTLVGEMMNTAENSGDKAAVRLIGEATETLSGIRDA